MFVVGDKVISREALLQLRMKLLQCEATMDEFEARPAPFIDALDYSQQADMSIEHAIDIREGILGAPAGTRFLMLDYCLSTISAAEGAPDAEPNAVPAVAANVAAIYNALVVGNAMLYHTAAAFAVAMEAAVYSYAVDGASAVKPEARPVFEVEMSDRYLESDLHRFFQDSGFGKSRERMIIRTALTAEPTIIDEGKGISRYSYRGNDFVLISMFDVGSGRVRVEDGKLERRR